MTSRKARDRSSASFNELVRELSYPDTTEATFAASKVYRFKVVDSFVYRSDVMTFVWIPIVAVLHFLFRTDQFVSFSSFNACRSDVCHFDVCRSDFCRSDACCSDLCRC